MSPARHALTIRDTSGLGERIDRVRTAMQKAAGLPSLPSLSSYLRAALEERLVRDEKRFGLNTPTRSK